MSTPAQALALLPSTMRNLSPQELAKLCIDVDDCLLASNGAIVAYSGVFTGRTPKDKFIVRDRETQDKVWWGGNQAIDQATFERVRTSVVSHLETRTRFVVDVFAGADPKLRQKVRFIVERPYHAMFVSQLFLKPTPRELELFEPDWVVMDACKLQLDPKEHGSRSSAGILLSFLEKQVIIAGTEYAGEMKKSVFTLMNYLLPLQGVLSMHCSCNVGDEGDAALFFGLSGTGKTTLSTDADRKLIGDDEHGWSDQGIFNIEGGCYAKCVNLSQEREPEIWNAIGPGAILENVVLNDRGEPDFRDQAITENTRAAYPLSHIPNSVNPSLTGHPRNIVFLTCDAMGVLPPISRLTPKQVLFYFLNGYTAKVAGTETGVTEPTLTFSTCFGQPFLPLDPHVYADLLRAKIEYHGSKVWLLNTGWTGGGYGSGTRIPLAYTRAMLKAALGGHLDEAPYAIHPIFGLRSPTSCPDVPTAILDQRSTWEDQIAYDLKAQHLQGLFEENGFKFGVAP